MMSEQRRQYSRIRFSSDARLLVADREFACAVHDLSLKGALLTFDGNPPHLPLNERCLLEIRLDDTPAIIRMEGDLAHAEGRQLGLACREIDLDSITHLRRLLALNAGDADLLNREFGTLVAGTTN
jgi:hypothetical protein